MAKKKQKKRMGRPPLPPEGRRSAMVTIRMTAQERTELERESRRAGLSFSAYLLKRWREKGD